jgi:hypothetical protein
MSACRYKQPRGRRLSRADRSRSEDWSQLADKLSVLNGVSSRTDKENSETESVGRLIRFSAKPYQCRQVGRLITKYTRAGQFSKQGPRMPSVALWEARQIGRIEARHAPCRLARLCGIIIATKSRSTSPEGETSIPLIARPAGSGHDALQQPAAKSSATSMRICVSVR